jgi:hypothetical protein
MLLTQGFEPDEIPYPLQPQTKPDNYEELIQARVESFETFRSMQLHNRTGYGDKPINVAKATLYNIMPAGSQLIVPDSLWNSPFWAGMLAGNALRGGRVYLVSPALDNAPSAGFPQMSRAQEIFTQLIVVQQMLGEEIFATGGRLRTAIYAVDIDVGDFVGRARDFYDTLSTDLLLLDYAGIEPGDTEAIAEIRKIGQERSRRVTEQLIAMGFSPDYVAEDEKERRPKLHLKAQLFMTADTLAALRMMDTRKLMDEFWLQRARHAANAEQYLSVRKSWTESSDLWAQEIAKAVAAAPPDVLQGAASYMTVGSHNMDYRGMMMDGEVLYITSGRGIISGLLDLIVLTSLSTWVEDLETMNELVPPYSEWQRLLGRYIKYAL